MTPPHPNPSPSRGGALRVRVALAAATSRLKEVSETARLDAELLMAHALGVAREDMLLDRLDEEAPATFEALVRRRLAPNRSPTSSAAALSGRSRSKSAPARSCRGPTARP